jgi:hypothetical protein
VVIGIDYGFSSMTAVTEVIVHRECMSCMKRYKRKPALDTTESGSLLIGSGKLITKDL